MLARQDSNFSLASSTRATAQEVHDLVYGTPPPHAADAAAALQRLYEPTASTYENPLLTATSRAAITDVYRAGRLLAALDVPRCFRALRAWSELGDVCEAESFDGHRTSIVEHTLHVLLLPGLHVGAAGPPRTGSDASLDLATYSLPHLQRTTQPALAVPGTRAALPSPLHLQLRILSRIEFNDLGRVTRHRDFWDVKDLVALVPGAALAQYVGTRVAARALAAAGNIGAWLLGRKRGAETSGDEWRCTADSSLGLLGAEPNADTLS